MRKLIINADDLGYGKEVNTEIENCIKKGVITSCTLMANAPGFNEGVRIAKQYPNISIGVHLNIIEFAPLTNIKIFKKYSIIGNDGNFLEGAIFGTQITDELKQAIYEEWDAQISEIIASGVVPSHADSHQHTHTIPDLQDILCKLLNKYQIKSVRCKSIPSIRLKLLGNKTISVKLDKSKAIKVPKRNVLYRRINLFIVKYKNYRWNCFMKKHYHMSYAFYSLRTFFLNRNLIKLGASDSVIELMCHPGQPPFKKETEVLMELKSWLPHTYCLTNYSHF